MKFYELVLRKAASWFRPSSSSQNPDDYGPLLFVQIFCHKTTPYHFEENDGRTAQMFFTGNVLTALALFLSAPARFHTGWCHPIPRSPPHYFFPADFQVPQTCFQLDMTLITNWYLSGQHYSRTPEDWLRRQDRNAKHGIFEGLGAEEGGKTDNL